MQLQGTELAYYDEPGGAAKGVITLDGHSMVKTSDNDVLQVAPSYQQIVIHLLRS
jgi:hypothetical protein